MASQTVIAGIRQVVAELEQYRDRVGLAMQRALYREAEAIMTKAKALTPVDTGALRASGHVRLPELLGTRIRVVLGFGGVAGTGKNEEDVGYAVYVHENLEAHHEVGQAKFLEQPFQEAIPEMPQRVRDFIERDIGV